MEAEAPRRVALVERKKNGVNHLPSALFSMCDLPPCCYRHAACEQGICLLLEGSEQGPYWCSLFRWKPGRDEEVGADETEQGDEATSSDCPREALLSASSWTESLTNLLYHSPDGNGP